MSISGKKLSAKIGVTLIAGVFEWTAEEGADELDATTGADAGFESPDIGVYTLRVTMRLYLDITTGIAATVRRGTTISSLKLYADTGATTPLFSVPTFIVFQSTFRGQVRDKFVVDVMGKAKGTYTYAEPN